MAAFKKHFLVRVGLISFIAIFISSAGLVLAAWQEPQSAPPQGNPAAPLDVSDQTQEKTGDLTVSAILSGHRLLTGNDASKLIRLGNSDSGVQFLNGNIANGRIYLSDPNNLEVKVGENVALQARFRFISEPNGDGEFPDPVLLFGYRENTGGLKLDNDGKLKFRNDGGEWTDIGVGQGGGESLWQATDASKIYYTAGNVGIGINNPTFLLDVNGIARFGAATITHNSSIGTLAGGAQLVVQGKNNEGGNNILRLMREGVEYSSYVQMDTSGRSVLALTGNPQDNWVGLRVNDTNNAEKWFVGGNSGDFILRRNGEVNDFIISEEGNLYLKRGSITGGVSIGFGGLSNFDVQGDVEVKKLTVGRGTYYSSANQANGEVGVIRDGSDGRFFEIVREDWWPEAYRGNNRLDQCDTSFEGVDCQSGAVSAPRANDTKYDLNVEFIRKDGRVNDVICGYQPSEYTDATHFCYRYKLLAQAYVSHESEGASYGGNLTVAGNLSIGGSINVGDNNGFVNLQGPDGVVAILRVIDVDNGENPEFQLQYGAGASDHWGIYVKKNADNSLNFWQGDNRFRIERNGGLGMNYGAPFSVVPADNDNRQWANKKIFETGYDNGLTADFLKIYTAGVGERNAGSKITILSNGNVGIGNDNPQVRLDINGNLKLSGKILSLPTLRDRTGQSFCNRSRGNLLVRYMKDDNKGWIEFGLSSDIDNNNWGCDGENTQRFHTPKFDWDQVSGTMKLCITGVTYGTPGGDSIYRQSTFCSEFSKNDANNSVRIVNDQARVNGRFSRVSPVYNLENSYVGELEYENW